jgi:hypothetical protein
MTAHLIGTLEGGHEATVREPHVHGGGHPDPKVPVDSELAVILIVPCPSIRVQTFDNQRKSTQNNEK